MTIYLDLQTIDAIRKVNYNHFYINIELNDSEGLSKQVSVIEQCKQH